jgi:hypothetical protein
MVVFLCHIHINYSLPISNNMLSRLFVKPPVKEKFISLFLKRYGLVAFPITKGFRGFLFYPVIKQQKEIRYFTINSWLSCLYGVKLPLESVIILFGMELGNIWGMLLFMVCRSEVWIPQLCWCLPLLHTKVLLPTLKWKGRGSIVGVAAHYRLDSSGFEPQWRLAFLFTPVQAGLRAHPATCTMDVGSLPLSWSGQDMLLTTYPDLVLSLSMVELQFPSVPPVACCRVVLTLPYSKVAFSSLAVNCFILD